MNKSERTTPDTLARLIVDPITLASAAVIGGVIMLGATNHTLFEVAALTGFLAGWSSAWSP